VRRGVFGHDIFREIDFSTVLLENISARQVVIGFAKNKEMNGKKGKTTLPSV
jgi:hypothetical protein